VSYVYLWPLSRKVKAIRRYEWPRDGMKEFYRFVMAALSCATNPRIPV
jgi:hypothetical protein